MAMRDYTITAPDGTDLTITGPDNATPQQLRSAAEAAFKVRGPVESPAVETSKPAKSDARRIGEKSPSLLTTAAQGPLFGFGDEIGGAITATLQGIPGLDRGAEGSTWRQRYEGSRDYLRGQEAGAKRDAPIGANALQIAASLPTAAITGPAAGVVKGAGIGANALRAAISGGLTGAVSGAGNSTAESAGGVAVDAGMNALGGAVLGGAAVPVASAIGAVGRNVGQRMSQSRAAEYAREKVAESISRDARGVAAEAGGDAAGQALARLKKLGPEARVVDSAGRNTLGLLDTLATLPGRTKDAAEAAIRSRQAGRAGRIIEGADEALGAQGRRAASTVDDLITQRSEASRPLYEAVHKMSVERTDALDSIISAAQKLGAESSARKIATAERVPYTLTEKVARTASDSGVMGVAAPAPAKTYSMRDLDLLKQGLDDKIAAAVNEFGRPTNVGVALLKLKNSLLRTLDESTGGAYAEARQAFAGPSAVMDAVNQGRRAMAQDDATIGAAVRGLSPSELDGFRIGAFESLRAKIGGTEGGRTELINSWKNPAVREKLKVLFGDERSYREFAATVASEGRMKGLESVGRGSQTAARQYGAGDLDVNALSDVGQAAGAAGSGNLLGMAGAAANAWNRVKTPEPVRDEMGRLLLSRNQSDLAGLNEFITRINNQRAGRAVGTGVAAGQAVNALMPR